MKFIRYNEKKGENEGGGESGKMKRFEIRVRKRWKSSRSYNYEAMTFIAQSTKTPILRDTVRRMSQLNEDIIFFHSQRRASMSPEKWPISSLSRLRGPVRGDNELDWPFTRMSPSRREWKTNLRPSVTCFFPTSHPLCNQHSLRHRIISYGYISTICPDVTRPGPPLRNVVRYRHPQRTKPFTKKRSVLSWTNCFVWYSSRPPRLFPALISPHSGATWVRKLLFAFRISQQCHRCRHLLRAHAHVYDMHQIMQSSPRERLGQDK